MPRLSVRQLFDDRRSRLGLSWAAGESGAGREFTGEMLRKPGVGLIGHLNLIHPLLAQVLGRREVDYIEKLEPALRRQALEGVCRSDIVAIIVADGAAAPAELVACADRAGVPVIASEEASQHVINILRPYMQLELGEVTTIHGVMLDVLEIGVLITGDSSIGKSELALELISRGHGLVADDAVDLYRVSQTALEGRCPDLLMNLLEVRGIGLLDIKAIFGETAVRRKMRLKLIVHLVRQATMDRDFERLPYEPLSEEILEVPVRKTVIAVDAGRNLAVLVEAAVRNTILQLRGIDTYAEFIERHHKAMGKGE
jgi:HPr kinase/phosphorylase